MGIVDNIARRGGAVSKLKTDKGILGTLLKPLDIFDAPGNAARSVLAGEFGNAALSLIPGGGSERISGQEALEGIGIDIGEGFFRNLGAEIALDPLTFVGGIGGLTKAGKLGKRAKKLATRIGTQESRLAILNETGHFTEKIAETEKEIKRLQEAFNKIGRLPEGVPQRQAFDVGLPFTQGKSVPLKPFKDLIPKRLARDLQIFSTVEASSLSDEIAKLQRTKISRQGKGKPVDQIEESLGLLSQRLAAQPKGRLDPRRSGEIRGVLAKLKRSFVSEADDARVQEILDTIRTDDAAALADIATERMALVRGVNTIATAERLTANEVLERIHRGAEFRNDLNPTKVDLDAKTLKQLSQSDIKALRESDRLRTTTRDELKKLDSLDPIQKKIERRAIHQGYASQLKEIKNNAEIGRLQLVAAEKAGLNLTPEMVSLIDTHYKMFDELVTIENSLGIKVRPFETDTAILQYVKRIQTPQAKKWSKKNRGPESLIVSDLDATLRAGHERQLFPELAAHEANQEIKKLYDIDFDFFDTDAIAGIIDRKADHYRAVNRAISAHTIVQHFGIPAKKLKGPQKSAADFFESIGLDGAAAPKDVNVPQQYINDAIRIDSMLKEIGKDDTHGWFRYTMQKLDTFARPFRLGLTSPFTAFHIRNAISNNWLNGMAGMSLKDMAVYDAKAINVQNKMRKIKIGELKAGTKEYDEVIGLVKELQEYGIVNDVDFLKEIGGGPMEKALRDMNIVDADKGFFGILPKTRRKFSDKFLRRVTNAGDLLPDPANTLSKGLAAPGSGKQFGAFLENNARIAHYMWKRNKGALPFEARGSVNRYLFDYGSLTDFERKIMRPSFLFYTWTRKNLPLQIGSSFTDPRMASFYSKLTNIGEGAVPSYLRGGSVFENPIGEGFVGSLGLPIEDLNIFNVQDVDPNFFDQLPRMFDRALTQTNPAIQMPIELAVGHDLFSRRPLRSINDTDELLNFFFASSPASRVVNTGKIIFDSRRTATAKLINLMSGVRTFPVSKLKAKQDLLERQALSTGMFERGTFGVQAKERFKEDPLAVRINKERSKIRVLKKKEKKRGKTKR